MLTTHCNHHCETHQGMIYTAEATTYQAPNDCTRVTRFLESIQTQNPQLQSENFNIDNDVAKRNNFEETVDFGN